MGEWIKRQLTVHNLLMILVLVGTFTRTTAQSVMGVINSSQDLSREVQQQIAIDKDLSDRVASLERANLQLSDTVARDFPRRAELDPRLRAIENQLQEQTQMFRRFLENYRAPEYRR